MPSSVQPAQAPQKPAICERLSGVLPDARPIASMVEFMSLLSPLMQAAGLAANRPMRSAGAKRDDNPRMRHPSRAGLRDFRRDRFIYNI
jgi:hypothetical protein